MKKITLLLFFMAFYTSQTFAQKGYEKSIEAGYAFGVGTYKNSTANIAMLNGYRFNKSFYLGGGVGFGYSNALNGYDEKNGLFTEHRTDAFLVPVFISAKVNLSSKQASPFIMLNTGYSFDINSYLKDSPGLMVMPAIGINITMKEKQAVYFLMGLNMQHSKFSYTRNIGTTTTDWEVSTKSQMLKSLEIRIGLRF
jgi:hypothetical protein